MQDVLAVDLLDLAAWSQVRVKFADGGSVVIVVTDQTRLLTDGSNRVDGLVVVSDHRWIKSGFAPGWNGARRVLAVGSKFCLWTPLDGLQEGPKVVDIHTSP